MAARLRVEFAYYWLVQRIPEFLSLWGIDGVLCNIDGRGGWTLMFNSSKCFVIFLLQINLFSCSSPLSTISPLFFSL